MTREEMANAMKHLVPMNTGPYCNPDRHGRERYSHSAYFGPTGKMVLDWAWEDRGVLDPERNAYGNEDAAKRAWYRRLLTPGFVTKPWGPKSPMGSLEADDAMTLERLYLGGLLGFAREEP